MRVKESRFQVVVQFQNNKQRCHPEQDIYSTAFENCINLESIYIPATVTEIGANAFDGCTSLSVIYVEASQEAEAWEEGWNLIDSGKKEEAEVIFGYQK